MKIFLQKVTLCGAINTNFLLSTKTDPKRVVNCNKILGPLAYPREHNEAQSNGESAAHN